MPSLNTRFIVAAALLGAIFSAPDALAETSSKVDLEQAKAELAKAKQEPVAEKEKPLADKKLEKETPRKRLFGRGGKKEEKAKKESAPTPELKTSEKEKDEASKPRAADTALNSSRSTALISAADSQNALLMRCKRTVSGRFVSSLIK